MNLNIFNSIAYILIAQRKLAKKITLAGMLILVYNAGNAQKAISVTDALNESYFGKNILLYQDHSSKQTFTEVSKQPQLFKANNLAVPNLGATSYNSWIKFRLFNDSDNEKVILDIANPIIDEADLFVVRENRVDSVKNSNYLPLRQREYNHQFYLFDIPLKKRRNG